MEQWKKRNLTPIGKVTLIKSLIISQQNHLFISLPTPEISYLKNRNIILFNFLWNSNVDKIKRKLTTTQKYSYGDSK